MRKKFQNICLKLFQIDRFNLHTFVNITKVTYFQRDKSENVLK